jgi:hypothetical protein
VTPTTHRRAKAPTLRQTFVTPGAKSMRSWHKTLTRWTFGCACMFVVASYFSIRWACLLVGLPSPFDGGMHLAVPFAEAVPLAIEVGMFSVASTATTIRKRGGVDPQTGARTPGAYYVSLWLIFSFLMALAQAANIGHAMVAITEQLPTLALPSFIGPTAVYVFGACFAALFPLGGTLLVHVSGFLRERGVGAQWIDDETEVVYEETDPGAARVTRPQPTAPATAPAAAAPAKAAAPAPTARPSRNGHALTGLAATPGALDWYAGQTAAGRRPTQGEIVTWFADRGIACTTQNTSKLRRAWEGALTDVDAAAPERDPIAEQVRADEGAARPIRAVG